MPKPAKYSPPSCAKTAMMDMYALYFMWCARGGYVTAASDKGGQLRATAKELRRGRVEEMLLESLRLQARMWIDTFNRVIPSEISAMFDENLIPWSAVMNNLGDKLGLMSKVQDLKEIAVPNSPNDPPSDEQFQQHFWKAMRIVDAQKLFSLELWENKNCNLYGGHKWAVITETVGRFIECSRGRQIKSRMYWLDQIYNLEHNTGPIVSKLPKASRVTKDDLAFCAHACLDDFIPFTSPGVASLIPVCQKEARLDPRPTFEEDEIMDEGIAADEVMRMQDALSEKYLRRWRKIQSGKI